jgi:hypothetical protein
MHCLFSDKGWQSHRRHALDLIPGQGKREASFDEAVSPRAGENVQGRDSRPCARKHS